MPACDWLARTLNCTTMAARSGSTTPQFLPHQAGRFSVPTPLIYVVVPIHTLDLTVFRVFRILSMGCVLGWIFLRALLFRFLAVGFEELKTLGLAGLFTWW